MQCWSISGTNVIPCPKRHRNGSPVRRALVEALRGSLPRDAAGLRQVPGRRPLQEALGAAERLAANLRQDHEAAWGFMSTFTKTVRAARHRIRSHPGVRRPRQQPCRRDARARRACGWHGVL